MRKSGSVGHRGQPEGERGEVRQAGRRGGPSRLDWSSSVRPMISWAVKLMPQVGKELPTKKLSDWSGKKFSPCLEVRVLDMARGRLHGLRHHLAVERRQGGLDRHGDLGRAGAGGRAFRAVGGNWAQNLRKPFSVSPANGTRGAGVEQGPHHAGVAALGGDAVEGLVAMASADTFCAVGSSQLPMTWCCRSCRRPSKPRGCRCGGRCRPRCRRRRAPRGPCRPPAGA